MQQWALIGYDSHYVTVGFIWIMQQCALIGNDSNYATVGNTCMILIKLHIHWTLTIPA